MEERRFVRIAQADNVGVALAPLRAGERALDVTLRQDVPAGHKFALRAIAQGERVVKYGFPIGRATRDIAPGDWVHTHNLGTGLSGTQTYAYRPEPSRPRPRQRATFQGYMREDGRAGTRNEIWILPTVGCVNGVAQRLAQAANGSFAGGTDGVYAFPHPYGCSQLGEDLENTQRLLAALARHPNAGGVLVLGLGCENNHIGAFREVLGPVDEQRVRFLSAQDVPDEFEAGLEIVRALCRQASACRRETIDASKLVVGLKCGGSDGLSGITANPLLGRFSDWLVDCGGSALLTEVPEMFGAETILMNRCRDEATFQKTVRLINGFKEYFLRHGQPVYENPSPGNRAGGITTLEDKSLGCTQKGGSSQVVDVLDYAQPVREHGLSLVRGPGNDLCAVTALAAAGAQVVLFTTGRGTPAGSPVPTVKVASNSGLAAQKPGWIDFDAGAIARGVPVEEVARAFREAVLAVASGTRTHSERMGYRDIAIFKDGVTL